jgi:hypothetical protein
MKLLMMQMKNFEYWDGVHDVLFADKSGTPFDTILILGEQESGKSTIGRALRWLLYGDMQGERPRDKYPNIWADSDGIKSDDPKESQHVIAKYVHPKEGIIEVTRTRSPGSTRTVTSMRVGTTDISKELIPLRWERFFGKVPHTEDDVEFFIRVQQMTQTAQTIGGEKGTYQERLLSFVNTEELISRMDEVVSELKKEYETAVAASSDAKFILEKDRLNGLKNLLQVDYDNNEAEILKLQTILQDLKDKKPDAEKLKQDSEARKAITDSIVPVEIELSRTFNLFNENKDGFELIYSHILYGIISNKNKQSDIPDKEKVLANSFDISGMISAFENKLSDESVKALKELSENAFNSSCTTLINSYENKESVKLIIDEYKSAQDAKVKNEQDLIELDGKISLDATAVELAELDLTNAIDFAKDELELKRNNQEIKDQIEKYETLIVDEDKKIAGSKQSSTDSKSLYQQWQLALEASNAVQQSKNEYTSAMFNTLINKVKEFWKEIDDGHSNADIEFDEKTKKIQLRDLTSKTPFELKLSDGGGKASSGQFEKALLCMAFGRASLTGLHMPVFIDDAMADMDPNHKKRAINSAASSFGQVIFVTNTKDTIVENIDVGCTIRVEGSKSEGNKSITTVGGSK